MGNESFLEILGYLSGVSDIQLEKAISAWKYKQNMIDQGRDYLTKKEELSFDKITSIREKLSASEIFHDDLLQAINEFQENVDGYFAEAPNDDQEEYYSDSDDEYYDQEQSTYDPNDKWSQRKLNSEMISGLIEFSAMSESGKNNKMYSLKSGSTIIGIMILSGVFLGEIPFVRIDNIVTHPGAAGAGEMMLELAASASVDFGCEGRLTLTSLSTDADGFYEVSGFVTTDDGEWQLDPMSSKEWQRVGESWRLKKWIGA